MCIYVCTHTHRTMLNTRIIANVIYSMNRINHKIIKTKNWHFYIYRRYCEQFVCGQISSKPTFRSGKKNEWKSKLKINVTFKFTGTNCIVVIFIFVRSKRNTKYIALSISFHTSNTYTRTCTRRSKRLIVEITYILTICRHTYCPLFVYVYFHYYYFFLWHSHSYNQSISIYFDRIFCSSSVACLYHMNLLNVYFWFEKKRKTKQINRNSIATYFIFCFKLNHFILINLIENWMT